MVGEDLPGVDAGGTTSRTPLLLVPDVDGPGRRHLLRVLGRPPGRGRSAAAVDRRSASSYDRAVRTAALVARPRDGAPVDTEEHLADLVVGADPEALADLRARVLAPLADLRPADRRAARRDAAVAGCCTRAVATTSPPSCTCTRRRCATGWSSCASCTATGSTTRRRCSSS